MQSSSSLDLMLELGNRLKVTARSVVALVLPIASATGIHWNVKATQLASIVAVNAHCAVINGVLEAHRLDRAIAQSLACIDSISINTQFAQVLHKTSGRTKKAELYITSICGGSGGRCSEAARCKSKDGGSDSSEMHSDEVSRNNLKLGFS